MRALLAVAVFVGVSAAAQAQNAPPAAPEGDPFAAEYGNTLTQTGPDGARIVTYINEDLTWEQHLPDGSRRRGSYRWQDDHTVCFAQTDPALPDGQGTGCSEVHTVHKVGESWTQKDSKGLAYTMAIVAGRR